MNPLPLPAFSIYPGERLRVELEVLEDGRLEWVVTLFRDGRACRATLTGEFVADTNEAEDRTLDYMRSEIAAL